MKALLEKTRFLVIVLVTCSLVLCVAALGWAAFETLKAVVGLVTQYKGISATIAAFIQLIDLYLLVVALYIFTVTIYELFIQDLDLPAWLAVTSLDELKGLLGNMVVLIASVSFLKYFLERNDPWSTLLYAASVALVTISLVVFRRQAHAPRHPQGPDHA